MKGGHSPSDRHTGSAYNDMSDKYNPIIDNRSGKTFQLVINHDKRGYPLPEYYKNITDPNDTNRYDYDNNGFYTLSKRKYKFFGEREKNYVEKNSSEQKQEDEDNEQPTGGKIRTRRRTRRRSNKKRTNKKKNKTRMKRRKTTKRKTNKRRRKR